MKRFVILFFVTIALFVGFSSCKKILAIFAGTDVTIPKIEQTIPAVSMVTATEIPLGYYSFYFNLDSSVRANTAGVFGANAVNSVKVKEITLAITNADSLNNIANLISASATLQSNTNNNPVQIFAVTFDDTYAATYTLSPTNSPELISYLKGTNISYTIYGKLRRPTTKALNVVLTVTVRAN